jgi:hypothetical protein
MKEIVTVRSNSLFSQSGENEKFELIPAIEIVIIHTDGMEYNYSKDKGIITKRKLNEQRLLISPDLLQKLITELQLHYKKALILTENAAQINALIEHISSQ